ncbi:MAG: hypothetical protein QNL43_01965 [Crocinitomicaceae bacterium]|jgi:hypothetical protein|tara:strand:+ start:10386 stop:10685 length:300 start_codon:yes stop_codon:yes gene_type:complete
MIKLGAKKFLFDFIYLGADINIGFFTKTVIVRESQLDYNSQYDEWSYSSIGVVSPSQHSGGLWYNYTENNIRHNLDYGLSIKIGAQIPINNRFDLIFQY